MPEAPPDTSPEAIGHRLVAVREARQIRQAEMARMMDTSPQRWNRYEKGHSTPAPALLLRFCQRTGANADYLLFGRMDTLPYDLAEKLLRIDHPERDSA